MEAAFLAERDVNDPYFLPLHLPLNRNGEDGEISRVNRLIAEIYFYPLTDPMLTSSRGSIGRETALIADKRLSRERIRAALNRRHKSPTKHVCFAFFPANSYVSMEQPVVIGRLSTVQLISIEVSTLAFARNCAFKTISNIVPRGVVEPFFRCPFQK